MEERILDRFKSFVKEHVGVPLSEFTKKFEEFWHKLTPRQKAELTIALTAVPISVLAPAIGAPLSTLLTVYGIIGKYAKSPELTLTRLKFAESAGL